jgi:hypothetical protein
MSFYAGFDSLQYPGTDAMRSIPPGQSRVRFRLGRIVESGTA